MNKGKGLTPNPLSKREGALKYKGIKLLSWTP